MLKLRRLFFLTLLSLVLLSAQAIAGEDSVSNPGQSDQEEHAVLKNELRQLTGGKVEISTHPKTGKVRYIGVNPSDAIRQPSFLSPHATPEEAARGFLATYGSLLGLRDQAGELKVMRTSKADRGRSFIRFQQVHSDIPIFGGEIIIQTDPFGNIISAHSKIISDLSVNISPTISGAEAKDKAIDMVLRYYKATHKISLQSLQATKPELWIYSPVIFGLEDDHSRLVWRMDVFPKELLPIRELVLIDAHLGNVALHFNQIPTVLTRKVYDRNNAATPDATLPGNAADLKRSEGQGPSGILDVDNAYDYAGDTYNFYWNYFGRDSTNNEGMELISTTRYCSPGEYGYPCPFPNAFWNGSQMVYGQGYASADDVVAHELTHGVTDNESNLLYYMQSGAINEALSDIFGEFVDLTNGKGTDTPAVRWLIGEDLPGGAGRSMKDPPLYNQPDRMGSSYYSCTFGVIDNGGVHTNSGVASKTAYLMTDGDTFNDITVTGLGITKVAKMFYEAQTNLLTSASDYSDLYDALKQACANLVGTSGITFQDCKQVENAINATEMNQPPSCKNLLKNPGFESGHVGWAESSCISQPIIWKDPSLALEGNWSARLGGFDAGFDYTEHIYQDVAIPSNATKAEVQCYFVIYTEDVPDNPYDTMSVEVRRPSDNALLSTLLTLSNIDDTGGYWVSSDKYDVLSFKGQKIRLRFRATNDFMLATLFLLDDMALWLDARPSTEVTSFKINSGAVSTANRTVTLNNVATENPTYYMASENSNFTGASWVTYYRAPSFTLSIGIGNKTVWFKVKNRFGESEAVHDTIEALPPAITSFKINAGATSTAKGKVTLNNVATNSPRHYMASQKSDFSDASWQTYSAAPSFNLSPNLGTGNETKKIYFKVKNSFEAQSAVMNDDILALVPTVTSFKINAGATSTAKSKVTLNNAATNSPTHYIASEKSDFSDASWQTYSAAPSFNLSSGSGEKKVYFKAKNSFAQSSPAVSDDILAVAPAVTSFKINAGAASTAKGKVTLNNVATNSPTHYMASESNTFAGASWQPYSRAPNFNLSSGTGEEKVYFKVKNSFEAESDVINDTIIPLVPVVTSFKINAGAASTAKGKVRLNNVATNSPTHYMASESNTFAGASWQPYSRAPSFNLSSNPGMGNETKTVYFKVKNSFAESPPAVPDTIEALAPAVTSFKVNAGAASTAKGKVKLNNVATNAPTHYMASESNSFAGASWQPYSMAPSFILSVGAGTKTVYFKVKNSFVESNMMNDEISAAGSAPAVTSLKINAGATSTAKGKVTLNNVATNFPMYYMASESDTFAGADWQPYSTAPTFNLSSNLGTGNETKKVYFKVKNIFGESPVPPISDTIQALAPAVTSFKINSGASDTAKGKVTLNNVATNSPTYYMASEKSDFSDADWQTYSTAPSFSLSPGNGEKIVYFKVKNSFTESSPAVSDDISARAPAVTSLKINAGAASTAKGKVTLNNVATNSPTHYMASEKSDFSDASWQTYSGAPSFNLSTGSGTKMVYLKVKNFFSESPMPAISDTVQALAPAVTSFKMNSGASGTANGKVILNNITTNSPTHYMASESPTFAGASWQTYSTAPSFILSPGSGTKTVYFKVKNIFTESLARYDDILFY
jgi:Zn-dependent metalloprotease